MKLNLKELENSLKSCSDKEKIAIMNMIYMSLSKPTEYETIKNIDVFAFNCPNVYDSINDKHMSKKDFLKWKKIT